MKQSTRLITNTGATFIRMMVTIGLGLVGTRVLLKHLGDVDFGLIGALGATGALLAATKAALTTSAQRHFAYETGRKDWAALQRVFFTAWILFILLGIVLWAAGASLAPVIMHMLIIPESRIDAAWWVYQLSLLTIVVTVWTTPFRAMLTAHQMIVVTSIADGVFGILRFFSILLLLIVPWDLMITYVAMQVGLLALVQGFLALRCLQTIPHCRFRADLFDRQEVKRILHFAGWGSLGNLSQSMRLQGGVLLVTSFFGPGMNAANTIAVQIVGYISNVKEAIRLAVQPVVVGAEARGDRKTAHQMTLASSKYIALIITLGFIPVFLEAEQFLDLWLVDTPPFTLILTRLSIVWILVNVLFVGHVLALQATGDIGWFTRAVLMISALILGGTWLSFRAGLPVWWLPLITIAGMLVQLIVAVVGVGRKIELSPCRWLQKTLAPLLSVTAPAACAATAMHVFFPNTLWRFLAVFATYNLVAAPLIWLVAFEQWERQHFERILSTVLIRLKLKRPT